MFSSVEAMKFRSYTYPNTPIEACNETDMTKKKFAPIAKGKLRSNNRKNYYHIYLWSNQDDYERMIGTDVKHTIAMCVTDTWGDEETKALCVNPKLGELHFVSSTWDVNAVAHEVQHAILHRMRYLHPLPPLVLNEIDESHNPEDEEIIAYEAGGWVESCLAWLTNTDPASPYPKHLFDR